MREIKFRAWDKRTERYLYNIQYAYDTLSGFVEYDDGEDADYNEDCFGNFLDNERYVVEQFIGLKDKNGKDIYENDILKVTSDDGSFYVATVKWFGAGGYPAFDLAGIPSFCNYDANALATIFQSGFETCEVIGNIHNNPELLNW